MLLCLCQAGLTLDEARSLCIEEALCLLHHVQLKRTLAALEAESARIASLAPVDPAEQQRALSTLAHRAETALDRFYRSSGSGDQYETTYS